MIPIMNVTTLSVQYCIAGVRDFGPYNKSVESWIQLQARLFGDTCEQEFHAFGRLVTPIVPTAVGGEVIHGDSV